MPIPPGHGVADLSTDNAQALGDHIDQLPQGTLRLANGVAEPVEVVLGRAPNDLVIGPSGAHVGERVPAPSCLRQHPSRPRNGHATWQWFSRPLPSTVHK